MTDRIALDIETIPLETDPDFEKPCHWTVFAVALGHIDDSMTEPDINVVFRDNPSTRAENRLLSVTLDWIAERAPTAENRELLTYNGSKYDLPILQNRARRAQRSHPQDNVLERLALFLDSTDHIDLIQIMREKEGHWVSLDDALEAHSIDADEPYWLDKPITGADMPEMGLEILTDRPNDDLREAVRRYAASDVAPLFELDDCLRQESERVTR